MIGGDSVWTPIYSATSPHLNGVFLIHFGMSLNLLSIENVVSVIIWLRVVHLSPSYSFFIIFIQNIFVRILQHSMVLCHAIIWVNYSRSLKIDEYAEAHGAEKECMQRGWERAFENTGNLYRQNKLTVLVSGRPRCENKRRRETLIECTHRANLSRPVAPKPTPV